MTARTMPPVVLTGATGFLGRHVLHELARRSASAVRAIARDPSRLTASADWRPEWSAIACDISRDTLPAATFARDSVVLHLAAATGNASPAAMRAVNVEGTRRVLQAAKEAGVAHFVFVSSIAAGFRDQRWYHYAHAKREAEALVTASGIPCSIVRPTMIFGPESPIQAALTGLAIGGAPIVMGSGEVETQPVHVDDLATFLVALAADAPAGPGPMDVGGGERLTLRALLAKFRAARALAPRQPIGIPLAFIRSMLGAVEPIAGAFLPVTAGQLASFVNDSAATPNATVARLLPSPRAVDAMLTGGR
jgi:nucleoside-diphosphate-sugar epimerase